MTKPYHHRYPATNGEKWFLSIFIQPDNYLYRQESAKEPERKSQKKSPKSKSDSSAIKKIVRSVAQDKLSPKKSPEKTNETVDDKAEAKKNEDKTRKLQVLANATGVEYSPNKKKYHPINDAFWKRGEK